MAEIAGATVEWTDYRDAASPRILSVPSPLTEASVQDIVDTVAAEQADIANLIYDPLLETGEGKADLSGGVQVGITCELQHCRVQFEGRKDYISTGTATSADANGLTLTDNTATFITDGVLPGAWVVNASDLSTCTVLRVQSETVLILDGLSGGTEDDWDIGDIYAIWNVIRVETLGGNLVAKDNLDAALDPIFPSVGTQGLRSQSSSATIVNGSGDAAEIAAAVWDRMLSLHTTPGSAGEALTDAASGGDTASIAFAVWEESLAAHSTGGSAGAVLDDILTRLQDRLDVAISTRASQVSLDAVASNVIAALAAAQNAEADAETARKLVGNRWEIDTTANTLTIYEDDGTTPLRVYDLKDATGAPTSVNVFDRDPQ